MKNLSENKRNELEQLAYDIGLPFYPLTDNSLRKIAQENDTYVHYKYYDDDFDGLLVYDKRFHIHINLNKVICKTSNRARFTLAHELGHLLIEDHNKAMRNGFHPSKIRLTNEDKVESEANYFASALLMPYEEFRKHCYRKPLNFQLIDSLKDKFLVSREAALMRFVHIGTFPIFISVYRDKKLVWFAKSSDFWLWPKIGTGDIPPVNTVIGDYYRNSGDKEEGVEIIDAIDWFTKLSDRNFYEQCYYSELGYDISMVWFD